ncbi:hypothetical protein [Thauera humireducens]|uniref:Uncharacterized protein n=1 Tax=Thauera humireducens TaxID=1134435 RepID=A0A127K2Q8_9RHOO|nr:hypothetical protein [Thauera humireducens]AMO36235.1 hypothetical protein AC731_004370 [Thauera humireducens]
MSDNKKSALLDSFEEDPAFHFSNAVLAGKVDEPSARKLLRLVGVLLAADKPIPPNIRRWLGNAFIAIGDGVDPAAALRIKSPKGRPERLDWEDVFFRYHALFKLGTAHTIACAQVAADLSATGTDVDEKTVRNLYDNNFAWLYEFFPRDLLSAMDEWDVFEVVLSAREAREVFRARTGNKLVPMPRK